MKLIWEPKVYVVGKQTVDANELGDYLKDNDYEGWTTTAIDSPQKLVEVAGRVCYQSFNGGRPHKEYIEHILASHHGSVAEHAHWCMIITGVSRSLTHELIRHRAGFGFSELSQRYVDCSELGFVVPPAFGSDKSVRDTRPFRWWINAVETASRRYEDLVSHFRSVSPPDLKDTDRRKWARQAARSVLPECTATQLFLSGNARAFRNFLEQRSSRHADAEIRRLTNHVYTKLIEQAPDLFGDYFIVDLPDGTYELVTANRKV